MIPETGAEPGPPPAFLNIFNGQVVGPPGLDQRHHFKALAESAGRFGPLKTKGFIVALPHPSVPVAFVHYRQEDTRERDNHHGFIGCHSREAGPAPV